MAHCPQHAPDTVKCLDHLGKYRDELATLMVEEFHIIDEHQVPVEYREMA